MTDDQVTLSQGGYAPEGQPHVVTLSRVVCRLRADPPLGMLIRIQYRIVRAEGELGPWKVSIAQYAYGLQDEQDKEIITFHWHPEGPSPVRWPHVHLGTVALRGKGRIDSGVHVPTGRVSVEEVIRLAVELGAPARPNHERTLDRNREVFERYRTWP